MTTDGELMSSTIEMGGEGEAMLTVAVPSRSVLHMEAENAVYER